jgi:hypothetical protein
VTLKTITKGLTVFDGLAAEIVKASKGSRASSASYDASAEISSLEHHDYALPLRRSLARSEVREIIDEARSAVWPRLNHEPARLVSPAKFTQHWSGLGVQFQLAKLNGADGVALLGFYVREMGRSRLPLICVNTAHHPAAIGAAFCHEMGHHLVGRLFDSREHPPQLLTWTAYGEHLSDPEELAADVLVCLGMYPEASARKIFLTPHKGKPSKSAPAEFPDSVATTVLEFMQSRFGLNFGPQMASTKRLQYLAAVIHFAKLRRALLTEYDI